MGCVLPPHLQQQQVSRGYERQFYFCRCIFFHAWYYFVFRGTVVRAFEPVGGVHLSAAVTLAVDYVAHVARAIEEILPTWFAYKLSEPKMFPWCSSLSRGPSIHPFVYFLKIELLQ